MSDKPKPSPSTQELTDEIQRLKDDMASLKARFAMPPDWGLEQALAALAIERPEPMTAEEKGELFDEIQQFKIEISMLRTQIVQTNEKLAPVAPPDRRKPSIEED